MAAHVSTSTAPTTTPSLLDVPPLVAALGYDDAVGGALDLCTVTRTDPLLWSGGRVGAVNERRGPAGRTRLGYAAATPTARGTARVAELLALGADPNVTDARGLAPLHYASTCGHAAAVAPLVRSGAHVDARTPRQPEVVARAGVYAAPVPMFPRWTVGGGATPLHVAAELGRDGVVAALRDAGASPSVVDDLGNTPLHLAAKAGKQAAALALLAAGAPADAANVHGRRPLHDASQLGLLPLVEALLAAGADPNAQDYGTTPLIRAARGGHLPVVTRLLAAGADVDAFAPAFRETALLSAVCNEHDDVARALLHAGADPALSTPDGVTPLLLAASCVKGFEAATLELIASGRAPVNAEARYNKYEGYSTPLEAACAVGTEAVALALLDAGSRVDVTNRCGETPLHTATRRGLTAVVSALLAHGADPLAATELGSTPTDLARKTGLASMERLLSNAAAATAAAAASAASG